MTIIKTQLAMAARMMAAISVQAQENYRIPVSEEHEQMMTGQFEPTWPSLQTHETPEWLSNAKFGIWAHCHAAIHLLAHQRRL